MTAYGTTIWRRTIGYWKDHVLLSYRCVCFTNQYINTLTNSNFFFTAQLNFFFLMNIIRVLVMKLRQSQASDIEQTRKAVRAAIVLLPLLGITNLLYQVPALNLKPPWKFAMWSYVTHFLTSFQGFFIALIYCFLNGEVSTNASYSTRSCQN